jgi:hypothetical protein
VFLTNSIASTSANRVETVVNQWPLLNANATLTKNGDWAHLENVGYWFPTPVDLKTSRETRTGTWASLGGSTDTTEIAKPFVSLWLDHGVTPSSASAEYVIVPNVTASKMAAWAASRPLTILANNATASAVRDIRNGSTGITFWRSGSVDGISASGPATVFLMKNPSISSMTISAADPTSTATGTFTITLPGVWYTKDLPTSRTSRATIVTFPKAGGQTTTVTLTSGTGKLRSVR